jgi:hypothetical protein
MRRVLVTGMSGTGKSSALAEVQARDFRVVDTDEPGWKERRGDELVWREHRISELLAGGDDRTLFVSGCVSSRGGSTTDSTLSSSQRAGRRDTRPHREADDERHGKDPTERELVLAEERELAVGCSSNKLLDASQCGGLRGRRGRCSRCLGHYGSRRGCRGKRQWC